MTKNKYSQSNHNLKRHCRQPGNRTKQFLKAVRKRSHTQHFIKNLTKKDIFNILILSKIGL